MKPAAFTVCYRSCVDDAWIPFAHFTRRELVDAVRCVRNMAHQVALNAPWCLKRGRKVVLRVPTPRRSA